MMPHLVLAIVASLVHFAKTDRSERRLSHPALHPDTNKHPAINKTVALDPDLPHASLGHLSNQSSHSSSLLSLLREDFRCRTECEEDPLHKGGPCVRNAQRNATAKNSGLGRCQYCTDRNGVCRLKWCQKACDVKDAKCVPKADNLAMLACGEEVCQATEGGCAFAAKEDSQSCRVTIGLYTYLSIIALKLGLA